MIPILQGHLITVIKMDEKINTEAAPSLHYVTWAQNLTAPSGYQHSWGSRLWRSIRGHWGLRVRTTETGQDLVLSLEAWGRVFTLQNCSGLWWTNSNLSKSTHLLKFNWLHLIFQPEHKWIPLFQKTNQCKCSQAFVCTGQSCSSGSWVLLLPTLRSAGYFWAQNQKEENHAHHGGLIQSSPSTPDRYHSLNCFFEPQHCSKYWVIIMNRTKCLASRS